MDHTQYRTDFKGFDSYETTLGDILRGERATLGKSIEEAAADLCVKTSHILAIENCDPTEFELMALVGGYVRSYARYLGLDPDEIYRAFCRESGFSHNAIDTFTGMIDVSARKKKETPGTNGMKVVNRSSPGAFPEVAGLNRKRRPLVGLPLSAVMNMGILLTLIGGLAYGGWSLVHEVQQIRMTGGEESSGNVGHDLIAKLLPQPGHEDLQPEALPITPITAEKPINTPQLKAKPNTNCGIEITRFING